MIYLVTSIAYWDDRTKSSVVRGVYTDLELAKKDVQEHCHNLCEYYYNYIVIEARYENGIDSFSLSEKIQIWYELSMIDNKTVCNLIETPEVFKNSFGFS